MEAQREHFELLAFTIYYSGKFAFSNSKKDFKNPFSIEEQQEKTKSITVEEREKQLSDIEDIFG